MTYFSSYSDLSLSLTIYIYLQNQIVGRLHSVALEKSSLMFFSVSLWPFVSLFLTPYCRCRWNCDYTSLTCAGLLLFCVTFGLLHRPGPTFSTPLYLPPHCSAHSKDTTTIHSVFISQNDTTVLMNAKRTKAQQLCRCAIAAGILAAADVWSFSRSLLQHPSSPVR